jgi:hypothetical protein
MSSRKVKAEPAVQTAVTHVIDLDPADWYVATWRHLPPLPLPEPAPFDQVACAARVTKATAGGYGPRWNWDKVGIPVSMTAEEARFWLEAMTRPDKKTKPRELALWLERQELPPLTLAEVAARFKKNQHSLGPPVATALCRLFSPGAVVESLLSGQLIGHDAAVTRYQFDWFARRSIVTGLRQLVLPYLPREELAALSATVGAFPVDPQEKTFLGRVTTRALLAAALGRYDDVLDIIASWADGAGQQGHEYDLAFVLFGLGDARLVDVHVRRLKVPLRTAEHVSAWLAHTELAGLDLVRDDILKTGKDVADEMTEALALVKAPEAAPAFLELKLAAKAPAPARRWLDEQVGNAVCGLLPVAMGRGKLADAARDYLRDIQARGLSGVLDEQLQAAPAEVADRVREAIRPNTAAPAPLDDAATPDWLRPAAEEKPARLPGWLHPETLPPLVLGDRCLNAGQVQAVLAALRTSTLEQPMPLVVLLKQHLDGQWLDAFAWRVLEVWLGDGAPPREKWALDAVGLLGSDASAMKLAALVRAWPGQSQHKRAARGLECLRAIGTDTALLQLNDIAQKVKFRRLQVLAEQCIHEVARNAGLTREQLEDRIVPDLDLDQRGGRAFDFGPRQFHLILDAELKPRLRDPDGKLKADLPKPGAKDDPQKAPLAVAAWKLLKKQLRDVLRFQAQRLEQAMVSGRRWQVPGYEKYLVHHPLMGHLARRVLWGGYGDDRRLVRAFRVTEDFGYADVEDRTCTLEDLPHIGVVHPLHLAEQDRARWGGIFGDYEIIAPFPQLGRRIHTVQPGEEKQRAITRHSGPEVPAMLFMGILGSHGWTSGRQVDGLYLPGYFKDYPAAGLTAVLEYTPSGSGMQIKHAYFLPASAPGPGPENALPLGEVDPVALSEVLGTLGVLAAKGT